VKYFIQGAVASGIFLLGSSIIYFATGTTNLNYITKIMIMNSNISSLNYLLILYLGILFITISLLMKLAIVPFHM
tara:strand:- start:11783 stop:12007 length:225 start_codon:yes stop_codon:yes gene_type:complete